MQTIAITNRKGGVGKSTTALNLAAALTRKGYKVLLIDTDSQCNLTSTIKGENKPHSVFNILQGIDARKAIKSTPQGDFIAGSQELATADLVFTSTGKEFKLKEALDPISGQYDYCIIDTPPALGVLTVQALTAASYILIPTQPDLYGLQGIEQLRQILDPIKKYCNRDLLTAGVLITRYRKSIVKNEVIEKLQEVAEQELNSRLFKTYIRECNALFEAQVMQADIFQHAPKSNAAADYEAFTNELLQAIK